MLRLNINGKTVNVDVEADTPLLWVIRENVGLTGTKYGCGIAQCGACTVHINGVATRSCGVPVSDAVGKQITTIEGLAKNGAQHSVQKAWIENDVPQCGYCQSGMIMAVAALLKRSRSPPTLTSMPPSPIFAAAAPSSRCAKQSIWPPRARRGNSHEYDPENESPLVHRWHRGRRWRPCDRIRSAVRWTAGHPRRRWLAGTHRMDRH